MSLKAPPYLRQAVSRLAAGDYRDKPLWVIVGLDTWTVAKDWTDRLNRLVALLPLGADPVSFNWSAVAKFPLPIMLHATERGNDDMADRLARLLIQAGTLRVLGGEFVGDGLGILWQAKEIQHAT